MKKYRNSFVLFILFILVLSGCSGSKVRNPLNWDVGSFQYKNQSNTPFGSNDLKGKVWIADLFFTSCQDVCPPMTANFVRLQKKVKEKNLNVQFVSFSVDPEVDNPETIRTFASKYSNDFSNWNLLTGYKQSDIQDFVQKSFHTIAEKPANSTQVTHGTSFYLIDQNGKVVKKYSGLSNVPYENIIHDIELLTQ